ncbi:MAG: hypothetical protein ACI92Z_002310, partial [Paracoccaceae bacterium]
MLLVGYPSVPIGVRHIVCSSLHLRVQENEPMVMPSQDLLAAVAASDATPPAEPHARVV